MTDAAGTSRILTLVLTDLAGSTALKTERGDHAIGELMDNDAFHWPEGDGADAGGQLGSLAVVERREHRRGREQCCDLRVGPG